MVVNRHQQAAQQEQSKFHAHMMDRQISDRNSDQNQRAMRTRELTGTISLYVGLTHSNSLPSDSSPTHGSLLS